MKKRILSALLAAMMLVPALVACSDDAAGTPDDTTAAGDTTVAETTTAETTADPLADNLKDENFNGYNFRLFGDIADLKLFPTIWRAEENGETVNDAVYNRNKAVEDRFNVTISHVQSSGNVYGLYKDAINTISAGDDAFDLICGESLNQVYLQNGLVNLREIDVFDFDKPWWLPAAESQTMNGKLYTVQSGISYNILAYARCLWANVDLLSDYNVQIPYDDIRNGDWTLDQFISLTKNIYKDVNGDQARDWADEYGTTVIGMQYATPECFGIESVVLNDKGDGFKENIMSPELTKFLEKTCNWLFGGNAGVFHLAAKADKADTATMFQNGTVGFSMNFMQNYVNVAGDLDFEYTIVPVPKLDEEQEDYRSGATGNNFGLATTVKDLHVDGVIIEAMSRLGYIDMYPAYKDMALRGRYSTNKDCADMIDIISDTAWVSFAYMNLLGGANPQQFFWQVWQDGNATPEIASKYASMKGQYEKPIADLEAYYFGE